MSAVQNFSPWRLYAWSIRRELWQHRSIIYAPVAIGLLFIGGALVFVLNGHDIIRQLMALEPGRRAGFVASPLSNASEMIRLVAFITAVVYSLDALYSERRDRHVLFWKSLPVSDTVTVAAKASIPLLVVPAIAFAVVVATQLVMLGIGSIAFVLFDAPVAALWSDAHLFDMLSAFVMTLVFQTLWQAPIHGWLMLVGSWAARVPVLWAFLVPLGLVIFERYALETSWVSNAIVARFTSGYSNVLMKARGGVPNLSSPLSDTLTFLGSPELWAGLVVTALFIAGAVWMRRRAEPV